VKAEKRYKRERERERERDVYYGLRENWAKRETFMTELGEGRKRWWRKEKRYEKERVVERCILRSRAKAGKDSEEERERET